MDIALRLSRSLMLAGGRGVVLEPSEPNEAGAPASFAVAGQDWDQRGEERAAAQEAPKAGARSELRARLNRISHSRAAAGRT